MNKNRTPMKLKLLSGLAVAVVAIAGCSTPTKVDSGPIKAATFSFFRPGPLPAKGLRQVAEGGDVTVAYLIVVGNNVSTSSINDYFGYGPDATALIDKAHKAYTEGNQREYFEAGTLLIDIVNPQTQKVLRRNYVTRPILQNPTAEVRQAHIQEAVNDVLQGLRIER
jgi:hypothetical protein